MLDITSRDAARVPARSLPPSRSRLGGTVNRSAQLGATRVTSVPALLARAVLLALGILSSRVALRLGVPALLLFLGLGKRGGGPK